MKILAVLMGAAVLTGCATSDRKPVEPLIGPPVQASVTPYSDTLTCIGSQVQMANQNKFVLAVGNVTDKTGKFNYNEEGFKVTQGAEDMVISALAKTNAFNLVERGNLQIPSMEIQYANDFLLSDHNKQENYVDKEGRVARAIRSGVVMGSDYIIIGSINEINFNLKSDGFDLSIDGIGPGWRSFWEDVAMDLRVVNTKTTQIVMTIPLRKQIWGYENKLGVLHFFGNTLVDANAGSIKQEPIQLAVRSMIEDAAVDITKQLYQLPENACNSDGPLPPPYSKS